LRLCPTFAAIHYHWSSSDTNKSHWSSTTANLNMGAQSGLVKIIHTLIISVILLSEHCQAFDRSQSGPSYTTFGETHSLLTKDGPNFMKPLSNYTVRVGNEVTFTCQVQNNTNYKVAWLHSEKGIIAVYPDMVAQNDRFTSSFDNRDSWFLMIKEVQESDAGKYICQLNTERPISISGTLSVVVPPNIIDETSSGDTLATEGRSVTLNCDATGTPRPTITWKREDGEKIRLCEHHFTEDDKCNEVDEYIGDSLTLININRFQSGVYLCIAKNNVPPPVSKRVQLYVDFPPTLWITHQLVGVELGGVATIECLTAAHPKSLNFWHDKYGQFISQKANKFHATVEEGSPSYYNSLMRLKIMNVTKEDFGKYTCRAKNSLGETSGEITLYEIVVSTTSTTTEYGVWDIWETTEEEEPDDMDKEMRALWNKRREERRMERERRKKDRESRRRQEKLYEKDYFSNSKCYGVYSVLLVTCLTLKLFFV